MKKKKTKTKTNEGRRKGRKGRKNGRTEEGKKQKIEGGGDVEIMKRFASMNEKL